MVCFPVANVFWMLQTKRCIKGIVWLSFLMANSSDHSEFLMHLINLCDQPILSHSAQVKCMGLPINIGQCTESGSHSAPGVGEP